MQMCIRDRHLPQVSYVAEIAVENKAVTVKRLLEDGYMTIKVQTPCLLTCVKELNDARYMSVGGIMECYNKPLEIYNYETLKDDPLIDVDTIGLKGSPTNVYKSLDVYKRQGRSRPSSPEPAIFSPAWCWGRCSGGSRWRQRPSGRRSLSSGAQPTPWRWAPRFWRGSSSSRCWES